MDIILPIITITVIGFGCRATGRDDGPLMGGEGLGFRAIGNTVADRATPSIFHVKASCPRRADLCLAYVQPLGN